MNYLYAALAALIIGFGGGFYLGGLKGTAKADTAKTAQEAQGEAIAQTNVKALQTQAAHEAAEQINDNTAEIAHAKSIETIDTGAARTDPLFVQSGAAAKGVCRPAVPSTKTTASSLGAGAAAGGSGPSVGDGVDRRPEIEALKKKLERIAADERLLIAEWPK
jgi:hypothetical protein